LSENPSSDRYHSGLEFMRSLLAGYEKTGKRSYLTNRLEGRRRQPTNANPQVRACEVDVYEMYWADLSRLGTDPLRVFGSIYHLLLHLSELGMLALRGGSREFGTSKRWSALVTIQSFAVWLLTLV